VSRIEAINWYGGILPELYADMFIRQPTYIQPEITGKEFIQWRIHVQDFIDSQPKHHSVPFFHPSFVGMSSYGPNPAGVKLQWRNNQHVYRALGESLLDKP
jgi:hypothetical protein